MLALGWRRPEWVAGAVGFAALVVIAPFAVRLPGRGLTAAILLAIAVAIVGGRHAQGGAAAGLRARPRRRPRRPAHNTWSRSASLWP